MQVKPCRWRALGLALGLCVLGCSNGANGAPDAGSDAAGDAGPTAQQACEDWAHALCTRTQGCAPGLLQRRYGDEGTCETRNAPLCLAILAAQGVTETPASREACAQAIQGWSCTDFVDGTSTPAACQTLPGTTGGGATCAFDAQCQTGFCAIPPTVLCGVCATLPAPGDSCAQLAFCGPGLECTTDTKTCVAPAKQGDACGKGAPCGDGLSCVGANDGKDIQGTCQTAVSQIGAPCDPAAENGPDCDANQVLTCNTQSRTCLGLAIGGGGAPCGTNDVAAQTADCSDNGVCTGATGGIPGTCTAAAPDEAACDTTKGPGCLWLARCITGGEGGTAGTCQPRASGCP